MKKIKFDEAVQFQETIIIPCLNYRLEDFSALNLELIDRCSMKFYGIWLNLIEKGNSAICLTMKCRTMKIKSLLFVDDRKRDKSTWIAKHKKLLNYWIDYWITQ